MFEENRLSLYFTIYCQAKYLVLQVYTRHGVNIYNDWYLSTDEDSINACCKVNAHITEKIDNSKL